MYCVKCYTNKQSSNQLIDIKVCVPVGSGVVVRDSVAPGRQAQGESNTGSSGEEEHAQTQQQREESREQRAAGKGGKMNTNGSRRLVYMTI